MSEYKIIKFKKDVHIKANQEYYIGITGNKVIIKKVLKYEGNQAILGELD